MESYAKDWKAIPAGSPARQEMNGIDTKVLVLSPTIALVARTTQDNRAYDVEGKVSRARFASFFVYVLEDGVWKAHSGQQAAWPIDPTSSR
jgi:hypothetical protein